MLVHLIALLIFTVFLALRLDDVAFTSTIPGHIKEAVTRTVWSSALLFVWSLFKVLLCRRLAGLSNLDYSEIMSPIFIVLQLIAIRACQLH
ncbi:unnamed protein product [Macrosiphum euphorbiae]|uniref:Uncharacterized protein n=1 Tax=Macrosiphum euphorbiae TaxID=13131 RepID=A0AAV0VZT3_9HEMI|nr:unnamed protein product [Macrosiphum euphorbiae]